MHGPSPNEKDLKHITGIEEIKTFDDFKTDLESLFADGMTCYYLQDKKQTGMHHSYLSFCKTLEEEHQEVSFEDFSPLLAKEREYKSRHEIKVTEQAMTITSTAFSVLFSRLHTLKTEKEAEALLTYIFTKHHGTHSYQPICAAGKQACTLHYTANHAMLGKNQLLLIDAGCERLGYKTDVTRTVPVSGKFSDRQRQVYEACLRVQEYAISLIKPKLKLQDLEEKVRQRLIQELLALELITQDQADEGTACTKRFFPHRVGHFLGLDIHDPSTNFPDGTLQPGHLFTVEPGIYIPEEEIGVRIEDTVLVEKDSCRVLSEQIPKTVKKLERLIKTTEK